MSGFVDVDSWSLSGWLRCCCRQKLALLQQGISLLAEEMQLCRTELCAINFAAYIKSFGWKLSCKKHRSLPLSRGHYYRIGLCGQKNEVPVF